MSVYFDLGLSVTNIEDHHIKQAFTEDVKDAKKIISLSNARYNKISFDNGDNFCSYCDVEKQNPLTLNSFRLYCDDISKFKSKPIAYFYSREVPNVLTTDHINPHSKGGSYTDIENLTPCCRDCNNKKKNILFSEFYERVMLQNKDKYGAFIEEMIVNPDYQKFVDALKFEVPADFKDEKPALNSTTKNKKIKQNHELMVLKPMATNSPFTKPKSIKGDKQIVLYVNCKLRSIKKLKQSQLIRLIDIFNNRLEEYKDVLKQIFSDDAVENFDYCWALKKMESLVKNWAIKDKTKDHTPTLKMDYKLEMVEDDYWFDYLGNKRLFSDFSDDELKKLIKSVNHGVVSKSFRYIPNTFIGREQVDTPLLLKRLNLEISKRKQLCKQSELL